MSGRESVFSHASIFLGRELRCYATNVPSFIQNTKDFLLKLVDVRVPSHAILASFDMVSLYTSIDFIKGVEATKKALSKSTYSAEGKEFMIKLLYMILTCKYFSFENDFYLQCCSTTMGTKMGARVCKHFSHHPEGGSYLCILPL